MGTAAGHPLYQAAQALARADAIVVTAGAGMGVDSGLPDFRAGQGFWRAYPPYAKLGLCFEDLANPRWFDTDPELAWGFYGHRLELYRRTRPHEGFGVLLEWAHRARRSAFVFTSNVDGQFQQAGFDPDRLCECHGSLHWLQCTRQCGAATFPAEPFQVKVDPTTFRAERPFPTCPACGALARPNLLMFGDWGWDSRRSDEQEERFSEWLDSLAASPPEFLVVIECGAGTEVPTIRRLSEGLVADGPARAQLIRINVREPEVPAGQIGLAMGAREALLALDKARAAHT